MRNKKLLASLLSVALVVSALPMDASANEAGKMSTVSSKIVSTEKSVELADTVSAENEGMKLSPMSEEELAEIESALGLSGATVEEVSDDVVSAELTEEATGVETVESLYAPDDVVKAIIITEDESLLEQGYEADEIGSTRSAIKAENALEESQNEIIENIEEDVLDGESLDVDYTFQYATSAISVTVTYEEMLQIAELDGVKTAFVAPQYELDPNEYTISTVASAGMIGKDVAHKDLGYTGVGTKIAIIDTGIDYNHPSFVALDDSKLTEDSMDVADIADVLPNLNAYDLMKGNLKAEDLYHTTKIAYSFNYVDENIDASHNNDTEGDHGTHVAGIAAADKIDTTDVIGVAPDAQLVVCKVFGANGGAYFDDILAAIEDCIVLDVDAINMSLGSSAGFSSEDAEIDEIFARVAEAGIVMSVSAGNSYSAAYGNASGYNLNTTDKPDNAIVGSPSTYSSSTSVASVNSVGITSLEYVQVGEDVIALTTGSFPAGYSDTFISALGGKTVEYAMVGNMGQELSDFTSADVAGKVAVVSRGSSTFASKMALAKEAGAIGVIVYNNTSGTISMDLSTAAVSECIPAASITQAEGEKLALVEEKVMTVSDGAKSATVYSNDPYYTMSDFSSWGVTADLTLVPDITAPGGNIFSCYDKGNYGLMSGTSMAAPQVAGCFALMKERLHAEYPEMTGSELYTVTNALLMSTAVPVIKYNDDFNDVEYSPRKQGAGLVDLEKALVAETYLSVPGVDKPAVSLYDDPERTGSYSFTFDVVNMSDAAVTYSLDASVLTESATGDGSGKLYMLESALCLDDAVVTFDQDTVTVPANGKASVSVAVELSAEDKAYMDSIFANGIYVEGFVYLSSDDAEDLSLPYMGFYGDWTSAPMLDEGYYNIEDSKPTAQWNNTIFTEFGSSYNLLGANPYYADSTMYHNVMSPNGDNYCDRFDDIYIALLRNAKDITISYTDVNSGEVYHETVLPYVRKEYYNASAGQMIPVVYSDQTDDVYDFTDTNGAALADGTVVEMKTVATLDYAKHAQHNVSDTWTEEILIDSTAPTLVSYTYANGELTLTAADNGYLAGVVTAELDGSIHSRHELLNELGQQATITIDVDGLGQEFFVILGDYGSNQRTYKVVCSANKGYKEKQGLAGLAYDNSVDYFDFETGDIIPSGLSFTGVTITAADTMADGSMLIVCTDKSTKEDQIVLLPKTEDGFGNLKAVGTISGTDIRDISYGKKDGILYAAGGTTGKVYKIDLAAGSISSYKLGMYMSDIQAITVDAAGNIYFADNEAWILEISATGSLSQIANFELALNGKYQSSLEYDEVSDAFYYTLNADVLGGQYLVMFDGQFDYTDEAGLPYGYYALFTYYDKVLDDLNEIKSELGTWVSGNYSYSKGAPYSENESRLVLLEKLDLEAGDYTVGLSNAPYVLVVREISDADSKVTSYNLTEGQKLTVKDGFSYKVFLYTTSVKNVTYETYKELFKGGFKVEFTKVADDAVTSIETAMGTWVSGNYSVSGKLNQNVSRISLTEASSFVAGHEYQATISNGNYKLILRKVAADGAKDTIYLTNGQSFVAEEGASYFITLYNTKSSKVTFADYVALFAEGFVADLTDLTPEEVIEETEETVEETEEAVVETEEAVVETEETVAESEEAVVETEETVVESEEAVAETEETVVESEETVVEETIAE